MRGALLSDVRLRLRAQLGQTMDVGAAQQDDTRLNYLLSNKQRWLEATYDWSFLEHKWDVPVPQGSRYLDFPILDIEANAAVINIERPLNPEVFFNQVYQPLTYGIGGEEFTYRNSDLNQAADPVRNWQFVDTLSASPTTFRFEVWPIPVSSQTIRFTGQRALRPFEADVDRCDLDDMLLVYMVAAEELASADNGAAQLCAGLAKERMNKIMSILPHRDERLVLGQASLGRNQKRRFTKLIGIAGGVQDRYVPDP